jgi:nitrogen fixation protein
MSRNVLLSVLTICFLVGCANVDIKPISTDKVNDSSISGARFYRPWPYLLVTVNQVDPNAAGGGAGKAPAAGASAPGTPAATQSAASSTPTSSMQIIWLPKMNEPFVIDVKPGWGTVNGTFTLDNGWNLSSVGSQLDSKIPETLTAVSGLVTAAVGAGAAATPGATAASPALIPPGLYRINFDNTGLVSGLTLVKP